MLPFRTSWTLGLIALALGCSGSVETIPAEEDHKRLPGEDGQDGEETGGRSGDGDGDGDGDEPVEAGGGTSSGGGTGSSGVGSGGDGALGGGPGMGAVVGEFHFSFSAPPFSDSTNNGVQAISLVPLPENATVVAHLANTEITTGVAGSMVFLLKDCEDLGGEMERCELDIVSFGGSASSMGLPGEYPYDGRLKTFAKQETFTTTVMRDGVAWSLPPTDLGLILDVSTVQGTTTNLNETGSGPDFITIDTETGTSMHQLWIESFEAACDGDSCEVEFSAYERDTSE